MMDKAIRKLQMLLIILMSVSMLASCTSIGKKFTASLEEDISTFSDQTITVMSEADLGFGRDDAIYIRSFVDVNAQAEKDFYEAEQNAFKLLRGMVRYSLELTRIAETYDNDEDKVNAYADYMAKIRKESRENLTFTEESYAELIQEIRDQSTFREALLKAQAIVNLFGQYLNQVLDEFSGTTETLAGAVDTRIDERYKDVIVYQTALEKEKYAVLRGMGQLYAYYTGDEEAYSRLLDSGVIRDPDMIPKGKPSKKQMIALGEHLKERLKAMHLIGQEIAPDWETYRATHRELDQKHGVIKDRITRVRAINVLWTRAHLKMAAGKTQPAEWFDVQDVSGIVKLVL